jgi:hypothetical protein
MCGPPNENEVCLCNPNGTPLPGGVFYYQYGQLHHLPTDAIAASYRRDYSAAPQRDCTGVPLGNAYGMRNGRIRSPPVLNPHPTPSNGTVPQNEFVVPKTNLSSSA